MGTIFGVHNRLHITAGMLLSSYLIIARTSSIQNGKFIQFNKPTLLRFKFNRNDRIQKKKPFYYTTKVNNSQIYCQFEFMAKGIGSVYFLRIYK